MIGASNQAPMALAIAFDLLFAVLFPLRYGESSYFSENHGSKKKRIQDVKQ